ncbi:hypothetical protein DAETH_36010 (plasmid) [Deinococcus aetherius]|uniref:Ketoreductase domain-containing protein n=1 Tax=Deinococcus aetherius TaxID=200252 RepID=A0ABN6RJV7_9DEIO|nr:SDR family oxidoreductase [Deinococcus aetherius]BDP43632.1 hypothetical protein DAETH_36010 [Deinococcus aetherius]
MNERTILVTGATAGLGRAVALQLLAAGHRLIGTGRNEAALERLRVEVATDRFLGLRMDVTQPQEIGRAHAETLNWTAGRGVDVLINNAGYAAMGPATDLSDADLRAQFDTNVFGVMNVIRTFVPEMRTRRSGRIVNVSSLAGRMTFPLGGAYHASKYALEALSDALRMELAPFGVEVVVVEPGAIRTEFAGRSLERINEAKRTDSPYAPILRDTAWLERAATAGAQSAETVARGVVRAALAPRPRARSVLAPNGRLLLGLFRVLPTSVTDATLRRATRLTPGQLEL